MSRKRIVAGNWKMNKNLYEGKQLIHDILGSDLKCDISPDRMVIICPPFTQLELAATQLKDKPCFYLGAQNCHQDSSGAFTGEISANMLKSVDVSYVILGHSERREYFKETPELLTLKVNSALAADLKVIFCFGESLEIRESNLQNNYVKEQISKSLFHLDSESLNSIVLAYEPIWAIGTGKTATKEQAQEMHAFVRSVIAEKYGAEAANDLSILYGGSCKPDNAQELFSQPDVDGGLIGGAALNANDFIAIIDAL